MTIDRFLKELRQIKDGSWSLKNGAIRFSPNTCSVTRHVLAAVANHKTHKRWPISAPWHPRWTCAGAGRELGLDGWDTALIEAAANGYANSAPANPGKVAIVDALRKKLLKACKLSAAA